MSVPFYPHRQPWGKVAQYGAAKQVLAETGIDGIAGGSFRLRPLFALRELERGAALEEVAQWLGTLSMRARP